MSERAPNPEQARAIDASGLVFVSAGAGTGKTMVLVERFCRAVVERGFPVDSLLVITYTDRAAGELRSRIRSALQERGRPDLARELDGAWISTIHGFCSRLLRQNAVAAGIDPRFRVLDAEQALVLAREAFDAALEEFCADQDPQRTAFLVSYGRAGLQRMVISTYETLRSAGRPLELELGSVPPRAEREAALRTEAQALTADSEASEQAKSTARELLDLLDEQPSDEQLLDLSDFQVRGERAAEYEQARLALEQGAWDELALADRDLIQELLQIFERAYRAAKDAASALDFEDLQLYARDLLRGSPRVLERERLRFRSLLVDEFQDTNRLQCELIDLLAGEVGAASSAGAGGVEELFFVGDEFQSIYRFRHADVDVFRERRAQSSGVLDLTLNYRSRPEVLGVVNHLFAEDFGAEYRPLTAATEFAALESPAVELLVTDKASYAGSDTSWRRAEARRIAARVKELVTSGEAAPGEIVLLFAAGTDSELYEQELRALDLPTYRATGRGYYGQQQVLDLLAYLRLLHNRYDDEALYTVLASPFVGVSNDALVLLRRAAPRRPLFSGLERGLPPGLGENDERLFRAFRQRYERLAAASDTLSLEQLCEQIVTEHDYDLALLVQWDGRQRYANVRKLARMARSFEDLRGPDIEGFVRFVTDLGAAGASAQEAPAEEEGSDSVRLLTIHSAKGLEFKVVVVADAGRAGPRPSSDEILCLADGRLGFRVADPGGGARRPALGYELVRQADEAQEKAERRRLYYVAMTRASERLIVSGAIDPERSADNQTPIGWVLERLGTDVFANPAEKPQEIACGESRVLVRVDRFRPPSAKPEAGEDIEVTPGDQLSLFQQGPAPASEPLATVEPLQPLAPVSAPPLHRPRRLSYSALRLFESCSYRYYAERICGLRPLPRAARAAEGAGLAATDLGSAVHELLEEIDLTAPTAPAREELEQSVRSRYPAASAEDLERIERLVASYCDSELAGRVTKLPRLASELPFIFEQDGVLLNGFLDVVSLGDGKAFVLDYKTNLLDREAEEIVASEYRLQRLVYALACLRAGYDEVEVVYAFLESPDAVVSTTYRAEDAAELERQLGEAIERIEKGEFAPSPSEFACSDCPANGVVCAGMDLPGAPPRLTAVSSGA